MGDEPSAYYGQPNLALSATADTLGYLVVA
jgi:hypothetical protein